MSTSENQETNMEYSELADGSSNNVHIAIHTPSQQKVDSHGRESERCSDITLQIPPRPECFKSRQNGGEGLIHSSVTSNNSSSSVGCLQAFSFKKQTNGSDVERCLLSKPDPQSHVTSLLFPLIATPTSTRTYRENLTSKIKGISVSRSLSMPGRSIIIVRSLSVAPRETCSTYHDGGQITPAPADEEDQVIPEEDALCKICYETCEERDTFNMGCSCRTELRLVHEACALNWFDMKGNSFCDVCKREFHNLPVTLLRLHNVSRSDDKDQNQRRKSIRNCQDQVMLLLISSLCYFFFLEPLLLSRVEKQAILVAGISAFTLGLFGFILAKFLATKEYLWSYATFEFLHVALLLHISFSWLQWGSIISILMSGMLGFGIAMLLCLLSRFLTWREQLNDDFSLV